MEDCLGREIQYGDIIKHKVLRYKYASTTYGIVTNPHQTNTRIEVVCFNPYDIRNRILDLPSTPYKKIIHSTHNCIICNELYHSKILGDNLKKIAIWAGVEPNMDITRDIVQELVIENTEINSEKIEIIGG